jgi:hypothetical protein
MARLSGPGTQNGTGSGTFATLKIETEEAGRRMRAAQVLPEGAL